MTITELQKHYKTIYRAVQRERMMRMRVLREPERSRRVQEMDECLASLVAMKDALKATLPPAPEQAPLIDVPPKSTGY